MTILAENATPEMDLSLASDSHGRRSGMTKVERYGWKLKDQPGTIEYLDKKALRIDHEYQRERIATGEVLSISRNWSWLQCGAIVVARRSVTVGGRTIIEYWIVDGQHRYLAAMRRSDIETLPCIVFESTGRIDEARAFIGINEDRKSVAAIDKYRARLAGAEPAAVFVQSELERTGIELTRSAPTRSLQTASIGWMLRKAGEDQQAFKQVLDCVSDVCADSPIQETLIDGLYYLHTRIAPVTDRRLRLRLIQIGPTKLVDGAKRAAAFFKRGGAKVWADGMLVEINKGLRNRFGRDDDSSEE